MKVCKCYSLKIPEILEMSCSHFMAYYLSMVPLQAQDYLMRLRIAMNPFLLKDQYDLVEELLEDTTWDDNIKTSEQAFYEGIARIEEARAKGKITWHSESDPSKSD